ncbi:MAG TPA: cellulose biosynthesis protein CelD, partial [Myxococcales bacterium]|nr:cellulose biosynthesis protein CelD [Myxococcales bacterium]
MSMVVEQVSDVERFAGLRGAWEELWSQSGASVFSSWAWLHSWYRRWSAGRRLCLLVTRDEP